MSDFETDLAIEPSALDIACVEQPELFFKYAEKAVVAKEEMEALKLELEITEAEMRLGIIAEPKNYNLAKTTEAIVTAKIHTLPAYKTAKEAWLNAKSESAMLDKRVQAMDMRKRMLEYLISLHGQQYFAGPATKHNLVEAWERKQEDRQVAAAKKAGGKRKGRRKKRQRV